MNARYDTLGRGYANNRVPDIRIARQVEAARHGFRLPAAVDRFKVSVRRFVFQCGIVQWPSAKAFSTY